jgi:hypothetical protein
MSKTGRYVWRWDEEKQKMTWVKSGQKPKVKAHVYMPSRGDKRSSLGGYEDFHLGRIESKEHKRKLLKEQHLAEAGE